MSWRLQNLIRMMGALSLSILIVSCQDTIPQRSTISGSTTDKTTTCGENQDKVEIVDGTTTTTTGEAFTDPTDGKLYYCKDKAPTRPDKAVFWKPDFCVCKNGKPISYGNCTSFCSGRNTNDSETLFANFSVTESIALNSSFGNLEKYCNKPITGIDTENPTCKLEAKDDSGGVLSFNVVMAPNSNSLTASVQDLSPDKTYVLTLVHSGGQRSDSIQIIKFSTDVTLPVLGPLKNAPVTQYTCLARDYTTIDPDLYYEMAYRLHYYFIPRLPPLPIPATTTTLVCHDMFNPQYGRVDDDLYPRFEQIPGIFNLWDITDPRFYDNNGNLRMDIDEAIISKTKNYGGTIPADAKFFSEFAPPNSDQYLVQEGQTYKPSVLGYFMSPWIDQQTFKSYCLNSTHYRSTNPLFKALGDYIGTDTEGLYMAFKTGDTTVDPQGNPTVGSSDLLFIRETDLKQVWFYLKNNVPTLPTDDIVANVAVYFYYPLNKASPYVKSSTQRLYRVVRPSELNQTITSTTGSPTSSGTLSSYPTHDRKLGCIPKF